MSTIRRRWLRFSVFFMGAVIAIAWMSSYFLGMDRYHSNWKSSGRTKTESASWLISNFGSLGIAWRFQVGDLGSPALPGDASRFEPFRASTSALKHIHPEGWRAWHWIQFHPTRWHTRGSMETGYGHCFVPYWMLLAAWGGLWYGLVRKTGAAKSSRRSHRSHE